MTQRGSSCNVVVEHQHHISSKRQAPANAIVPRVGQATSLSLVGHMDVCHAWSTAMDVGSVDVGTFIVVHQLWGGWGEA